MGCRSVDTLFAAEDSGRYSFPSETQRLGHHFERATFYQPTCRGRDLSGAHTVTFAATAVDNRASEGGRHYRADDA